MELLNQAAEKFQNIFGSISLSTTDHRYFIVGFAILVVALIVITQDKSKAITYLILIYTACFVALLVPVVATAIQKNIPEKDLLVLTIIEGSLPIVALLVHKYKRGKKH